MGQFVLLTIFLFAVPGHALCVKSKQANLREKPTTKSEITWVVGRYTPLLVVEKKGSWVKVKDQDNKTHWVARSLLTNKFQCMAVKVTVTNLRKGPGSRFPLADYRQAERYTPFKRVDLKGDWYKVEDAYGQSFWVHRNNVWRPLKVANVSF